MPHVRLSADFGDFKRGEIVDLTDDEFSEADAARAIGKRFPGPVVGANQRPALESFGRSQEASEGADEQD